MTDILADYREWAAASANPRQHAQRAMPPVACRVHGSPAGPPPGGGGSSPTRSGRRSPRLSAGVRSTLRLTAMSSPDTAPRGRLRCGDCWSELAKSDSLWRANRMRKTTENVSQDI
jgi:hypothetical protein